MMQATCNPAERSAAGGTVAVTVGSTIGQGCAPSSGSDAAPCRLARRAVPLSDPAWAELAQRLGQVVADAGGAWLTIRAYEAGDAGGVDLGPQRVLTTSDGRCTVIV